MTRNEINSQLVDLLKRTDAIADGEAAADTIPTGFPTLDGLLGGGLRRGDLIVLGGDAGVGKSALALAIALRAAEAGHQVTFATGEMDPRRVHERLLAI
jgi:replicative DNA helicase